MYAIFQSVSTLDNSHLVTMLITHDSSIYSLVGRYIVGLVRKQLCTYRQVGSKNRIFLLNLNPRITVKIQAIFRTQNCQRSPKSGLVDVRYTMHPVGRQYLVVVQISSCRLHPELDDPPGQIFTESLHLQEVVLVLNHLDQQLVVFELDITYYMCIKMRQQSPKIFPTMMRRLNWV